MLLCRIGSGFGNSVYKAQFYAHLINVTIISFFHGTLSPSTNVSVDRGSESERRRKRRGLNPFDGFLDLEGIPMDPRSPMHDKIK